MEWKTVIYEAAEGIGLITLNRPERNNAWMGRMAYEYRTAMHLAAEDDHVGAIVVTGAGRNFCVGADNKALDSFAESGVYSTGIRETPPDPGDPAHPAHGTPFGFPLAIGKPVIAAVNGAAAGVGFIVACFADIRFGAAGAKWTPATSKLGLPAEYGISWLLPRLIGYGRAVEWMLSSRPVLSEEAHRMGLLHAVHPPEEVLDAALAFTRGLIDGIPPASLRSVKAQTSKDLFRSLADANEEAVRLMHEMIAGDDYKEGVAALIAKRPPNFASRYEA
jgi:enoyl-CoA hydratase/carnithine racemase